MSGVKRKMRMNDYFESVPSKKRKIDDIKETNPVEKIWSCLACTYDNKWWRTKCEICETKKEMKAEKNDNMVIAIKPTILVSNPQCITYNLQNKSTVLYYKNFLSDKFCDLLFKEVDNVHWEQPSLSMWGKRVPIPRLQSRMCGMDRKYEKIKERIGINLWCSI